MEMINTKECKLGTYTTLYADGKLCTRIDGLLNG